MGIIQFVARSEPEGAGITQIANFHRISRDTASVHCKNLVRDNFLKRDGKRGNYHLTDRTYGEPALLPFSIGMTAIGEMLDWRFISLQNKFCNKDLVKAIIKRSYKSSPYGGTIRHIAGIKEVEELVLFEFANRIGAIILYIFITAMYPNKANIIFKSNYFEDIANKDDVAMRWVENGIKPTRIFQEFCRLFIVEMALEKYEDVDSSLYTLDDNSYNRLMKSLHNLYPAIIDELEKIRSEIPKTIAHYRYKEKAINH